MSDRWIKNKYGVEGYMSHSGTMFGHEVEDSQGDKYFRTCIPRFVPKECVDCDFFDVGEFGDYGSLLAGPICEKNVRFPIRKGTCKAKRVNGAAI